MKTHDLRGIPGLFLSLTLLSAVSAAADPVLVEFRSADGTPLVAEGDEPTSFGPAATARMRKGVEARAAAIAAARDDLAASLPPDVVADVRRSYRHFPLLAMDVDESTRQLLAKHPLVAAIHEDRMQRPTMQSALNYIGAGRWHSEGYDGSGTSVAVLDTGVRYWNGFFGICPARGEDPNVETCRVKVFEGFATEVFGPAETDPYLVADAEAHGTNVGGIVGDMAPGTDLLSLGVFGIYEGRSGAADSDIAVALDWVIEHQVEYNIVSANMSLGSEVDPAARGYCTGYMAGSYLTVFGNVRAAGVLPVVATGNDYVKTAVGSPACIASSVRVGAGYDDPAFGRTCGTGDVVPGSVVCFSNSSALVDLIAPGNDIDAGGIYGYSGTSMATPQVAGLAAVYQARYFTDPVWTIERMRADAVPIPEDFADQPYVHRYIRMGDHDAVLHFSAGVVFASSFNGRPVPNGGGSTLTLEAEVECTNEECISNSVGAVYLDLNVAHYATGELFFELEAPDGTVARHEVAGDAELGKYNLNSILGSQHLPNVFDELKGAPIEGTWTLRVGDDEGVESGNVHRAVLLVDAARVQLDATLDAPAIARPGEAFVVDVALENRGNLPLTDAPLVVELVARDGGAVADSATVTLDLPFAPAATLETSVDLTGTGQGIYDVRITAAGDTETGLTPDLLPGLVATTAEVAITERTFAAFDIDPEVPQPEADAQLVDQSVGMITSYEWDFGDGTTSTDAAPVHAWTADGEYEVRLTVTGPDGTSTAARRVLVRLVLEPLVETSGSGVGCDCAVPGAGSGGWWIGLAGLGIVLALRRRARRRSAGPGQRLAATGSAVVVLLLGVSCHESYGTDAGDADGGLHYDPGPWVSLLGPADPSLGEVDLYLRLGHDDSLPCDLTVEYALGIDDTWLPATLDAAFPATGLGTSSAEGVEHHLRWRSTDDLPGDEPIVRLRVTATDGDLTSVPVETEPFTVLNFFLTYPHAVLITEVSTAERNMPGRVRDDYVELHNTTDQDLVLDGWTLAISSASGARAEFDLTDCEVPAGGWRTLVERDPESPPEYDGGWPLDGALPWNNDGYGSAALIATFDRPADFVRWGGSPQPPPVGTSWTDDDPLPIPQTLTVLNRIDEFADDDLASDFCVARPSPDEASTGCLPRLPLGGVLVTELDSQNVDDQVEILNRSGETVDLAGWKIIWDCRDLGAGEIPLCAYDLPDGGRLGLRDNGVIGRMVGGVMELGENLNIDGLVPIAVGFQDPYGRVIDFLAAGGSTIRWLDWDGSVPTPMPGQNTSLSRRPGDPDTDSAADFCLTYPNIGSAPDACLEPLEIVLRISEVMPGRPDWVEIYNPGTDPVDLSHVYVAYSAPGGSVDEFRLSGTLDPGALLVATDRDIPEVEGELVISGNFRFASNSDATVALRDEYGFGIDFMMWGEPSGTPLWPDTWAGLAADKYPTNENSKSIQRHPHDAADTNTRDDWCWAAPSPMVPNEPCE